MAYGMRINREIDFAWQAQYLVTLEGYFSWQAQHLVKLMRFNASLFVAGAEIWNDSRSGKRCNFQ